MKRNKFSLSHYKLLSAPMGKLIPVTWFEALPGDSIQHTVAALIRLTPLVAPVMHPVKVRFHTWFVPNRLIWDDFEDFITGGDDGQDATVHPYKTISADISGSLGQLYDYLGLACLDYTGGASLNINALPFRAYAMIWNENYRDQQLQTEAPLSTASGVDSTTVMNTVRSVNWEKDYFTTARTDESLGATVTIPLLDTAAVEADATGYPTFDVGGKTAKRLQGNTSVNTTYWDENLSSAAAATWNDPGLQVDLENSSGVAISDLRLALAIQRYQEARNVYGSRYVEYLRYLGVRSSDGRLKNPEYLGGGSQTIQFSEVLSTDGANTGSMKGHGISAVRTNRYRRFFEEHGIVMTLMSVVPKTVYETAMHRSWFRTVKEDYYQRELETIGEQEIYNKELYPIHTSPDGTFGYQARYDDYKFIPSSVAGDFRDQYDDWHFARVFGSEPSLNSSFITCTPATRPFASSTYDPLLVMTNHSIQARRMMANIPRKRVI
jgi:hypothetical protein